MKQKLYFYVRRECYKLIRFITFGIFPIRIMNKNTDSKVSAYLSIYNDADYLEDSLKMLRPYVDELIVVDGAFKWMDSILRDLGRTPDRSKEKVINIIRDSGIPFLYFNGVWENELVKREFGYSKCSYRYRMRIDSDEILSFDKAAFKSFRASGAKVAEMYMPTIYGDGQVIAPTGILEFYRYLPRQCFMFDSKFISAKAHLEYLWLVLPAESIQKNSVIYSVYEKPIAFNAHMTNLRGVDSATTRGLFYILNWLRSNNVPWTDSNNKFLKVKGDPNKLLDIIPSKVFFECVSKSQFVVGDFKVNKNFRILTPKLSILSGELREQLKGYFKRFLLELKNEALNAVNNSSYVICGMPYHLDVTFYDITNIGCLEFDAKIKSLNLEVFSSKGGESIQTYVPLKSLSPFKFLPCWDGVHIENFDRSVIKLVVILESDTEYYSAIRFS